MRLSVTDTLGSFSLTYEGYQESLSLGVWNSKGQVDLGILLGIGGRSSPDGARGQAKRTLVSSPDLPLLSSRFFFSPPRYASPRIPIPPSVFPFVSAAPRNRVILPAFPPLPSSSSSSSSFSSSSSLLPGRLVVVLRNGRLTFRRIYLPRDFIV